MLGLKIDTLHYDELLEVESYIITSQRKSPALFQGFYENIVTTKLETKELQLAKKLSSKYGKGNLNLSTGEFTPLD